MGCMTPSGRGKKGADMPQGKMAMALPPKHKSGSMAKMMSTTAGTRKAKKGGY